MDQMEWFTRGGESFLLALLNTIFVALAAVLMFRLKEVAPPGRAVVFWKEDLKNARTMASSSRKQQGHDAALARQSVFEQRESMRRFMSRKSLEDIPSADMDAAQEH